MINNAVQGAVQGVVLSFLLGTGQESEEDSSKTVIRGIPKLIHRGYQQRWAIAS